MFDAVKSNMFDRYRRRFGTVEVADPRPFAALKPYTFSLPSSDALAHLQPGHVVKLIFESVPRGRVYGAERMWVQITHRDGDRFLGVLDNQPMDIPQLNPGDEIPFQAHHIVDVYWVLPSERARFENPETERWFALAEVDPRVADGAPVQYMRREAPCQPARTIHPGTGWRFLADPGSDWRTVETESLPIGEVLNHDSSLLPYLDAPIGSAFRRTTGREPFAPATRLH